MTDEPTRTILITGAASGIGRATALLFAERGWRVGGYDVDAAGLERLEEDLAPRGGITGKLDVTEIEAFEATVAAFGRAMGGRLDLMHNNAGIGHSGWFEDVPWADAQRVIDINFTGVVNGVYAGLPLLRETAGSLCFSTCSASAIRGAPRLAVYAATKFAVKGLTESLSVEFERHGVRVADVLPGMIDTPLLDSTPNHSGSVEDGILSRSKIATDGPLRLIEPREVAECVWEAYHDQTGRLHWYVPTDLERLNQASGPAATGARATLRETALGTAK